MNKIKLNSLKLRTFTEQDAKDYCLLNNINYDSIIQLNLGKNELTDISGIKLFKNVEKLDLSGNKLRDISVLKDLINIKQLNLINNQITDISILKNLAKLKELYLGLNKITYISVLKNLIYLQKLYMNHNKIKNISVIQYLINLKSLSIINLELESDQFQYINSLKKLQKLAYKNGFKDMSVTKRLNKNIIQ